MDEIEKSVPEAASTEDSIVAEPVATGTPVDSEKGRAEPNEAFFGSLLLFCLALSLLSATGYFGFAGYRYYKQVQAEKAIPSIDALPRVETAETVGETAPVTAEEKSSETPASSTEEKLPPVDKKTLSLKVLNGGAAKGIAGTYAEKLKAAGFTKTVVGNAFGDYTGQTLYYAKGQSAGADAIKGEVVKTYPALTVKEAPSGDKDATAATYVLIIGR